MNYKGEGLMEEAAFCKEYNTWAGWEIYKDRIVCKKCKKTYKLEDDLPATSIINLANDNY